MSLRRPNPAPIALDREERERERDAKVVMELNLITFDEVSVRL